MIKAKHTWWADELFKIYLNQLLKNSFNEIHLFGNIPEINQDLPLILMPNHSTWWDGFFIYFLNKQIFKRQAYLMMLETQLKKYRFFAKLGAYSVDPGNPKKIVESLRYSVEILQKKQAVQPLVCIFPQGELLPWSKRPLNLKKGIDWLIHHYQNKINLLPLGIKTEFGGEQRPDAYFQFGENKEMDSNKFAGMDWLEKHLSDLLDNLQNNINSGEKYNLLFSGKRSVNIKMDHLTRKN